MEWKMRLRQDSGLTVENRRQILKSDLSRRLSQLCDGYDGQTTDLQDTISKVQGLCVESSGSLSPLHLERLRRLAVSTLRCRYGKTRELETGIRFLCDGLNSTRYRIGKDCSTLECYPLGRDPFLFQYTDNPEFEDESPFEKADGLRADTEVRVRLRLFGIPDAVSEDKRTVVEIKHRVPKGGNSCTDFPKTPVYDKVQTLCYLWMVSEHGIADRAILVENIPGATRGTEVRSGGELEETVRSRLRAFLFLFIAASKDPLNFHDRMKQVPSELRQEKLLALLLQKL